MRTTVRNHFRAQIINLRFWLFRNASSLVRLHYRWFWSPKNEIDQKINEVSSGSSNFHFLQIGANDGLLNDPIIKFIVRDGWKGIRVEPLPAPFLKLKYLHGREDNISPLQCLVADSAGKMNLFYLSFSESRWATGIASLDKSNLQRQIDNGYIDKKAKKYGEVLPEDRTAWINEKQLKVRDLNELITSEFQVPLDLLQIDVEGFDHKLIMALNLDLHRPRMICFEKLHIPQNDLETCLDKLRTYGYKMLESNMDYLAYLP